MIIRPWYSFPYGRRVSGFITRFPAASRFQNALSVRHTNHFEYADSRIWRPVTMARPAEASASEESVMLTSSPSANGSPLEICAAAGLFSEVFARLFSDPYMENIRCLYMSPYLSLCLRNILMSDVAGVHL